MKRLLGALALFLLLSSALYSEVVLTDEQAQELDQALTELETVLTEQQTTIEDLQTTCDEQEKTINELNNSLDEHDKSWMKRSVIAAVISFLLGAIIGLMF